jgi:hypothetical protein
MREERTTDEKLTDEALILALYHLVQDRTGEAAVGDRLKAMKLVFLANHAMFSERMKGLNCTFYRWDYGPMSNDVYAAWDHLKRAGLLDEEECIRVTARGAELASGFIREVLESEENRPFLRFLEDTARYWGKKSRSAILTSVYNMEITPLGEFIASRIEDMPRTAHLTEALDAGDAKAVINIEQGWLETLGLMLNPPAMESIVRAADDARAGRVVLGDDIWSEFESSTV